MFGFLKIFKRKPADTSVQEVTPQMVDDPMEQMPESRPVARPFGPRPNAGVSGTPGLHGKGVLLPLQSILNGLPLELQPRVTCPDVGDATISLPLEKILSQLSRGAVKISFGELRMAAPEVFSAANDRDRVLVMLPLAEILLRLNPALITRRRVQKQVEVPEEVSSPFDPENHSLIFSVGPAKAEAAPAPAPVQRKATPAPASHGQGHGHGNESGNGHGAGNGNGNGNGHGHGHAPIPAAIPISRNTITSAPTPPPPAALPSGPPPLIPSTRALRELNGGQPTSPVPARAPSAQAAPAPVAPPVPVTQPEKPGDEPLIVGLTALAEGWPEAVRQEIVQLNLVDAKVGLPPEVIERALKQGRIAFSWKSLRSWIKPTPLPAVSAHDSAVLELPLKVVAPLFLARQREASKAQNQVAIDDNIPNLFFGFPQAEPAGQPTVAQATAKPSDTNYYVWDDSSDTARVDESDVKRAPTPGTSFVAKYATPNEVVSRAAGLDGVAGSLIALPDGLMVASRLSSDLNGDTLAAFLPQIFGKVSQCTRELRMGDLNNLNFTVGNIPWKIFRVNAIFFAAFGRPGEALPTAQLAALAGELDHKPK